MSLTVSYGFLLSLTVNTSAIELLHVFHFPFQLYGVAACL